MQVGDLVKIRPHCYLSGQMGIVVSGPDELNAVIVMLTVEGTLVGCLAANLEVINENR